MQRVSNGLPVPKQYVDTFAGEITGTGAHIGEVECDLTYLPQDIDHIIVPMVMSLAGGLAGAEVMSLSGNKVTIRLSEDGYYRTSSICNANHACDGSGGAPSHGNHSLLETYTYCSRSFLDTEAMAVIRVHYEVA